MDGCVRMATETTSVHPKQKEPDPSQKIHHPKPNLENPPPCWLKGTLQTLAFSRPLSAQVEHVRLCCLLCLLYLAESGSSQRAIAQEKARHRAARERTPSRNGAERCAVRRFGVLEVRLGRFSAEKERFS